MMHRNLIGGNSRPLVKPTPPPPSKSDTPDADAGAIHRELVQSGKKDAVLHTRSRGIRHRLRERNFRDPDQEGKGIFDELCPF